MTGDLRKSEVFEELRTLVTVISLVAQCHTKVAISVHEPSGCYIFRELSRQDCCVRCVSGPPTLNRESWDVVVC